MDSRERPTTIGPGVGGICGGLGTRRRYGRRATAGRRDERSGRATRPRSDRRARVRRRTLARRGRAHSVSALVVTPTAAASWFSGSPRLAHLPDRASHRIPCRIWPWPRRSRPSAPVRSGQRRPRHPRALVCGGLLGWETVGGSPPGRRRGCRRAFVDADRAGSRHALRTEGSRRYAFGPFRWQAPASWRRGRGSGGRRRQ